MTGWIVLLVSVGLIGGIARRCLYREFVPVEPWVYRPMDDDTKRRIEEQQRLMNYKEVRRLYDADEKRRAKPWPNRKRWVLRWSK